MSILIAFLSLAVERILGYPDWLFNAIGHPVTWIGRLISFLDRRLNRATDSDEIRRRQGVRALLIILLVPGLIGLALHVLIWLIFPTGLVFAAILGSTLLSQKSLAEHVEDVADALETGGLTLGRIAVSRIVGRDPETLDKAGVARAAIESLAENFSDGIVAPVFWTGIGGLGGGAAYKAANTADSMIGHRTPQYKAFGRAAARFDDLINLPASRLTGLLIVLAAFLVPGADSRGAWQVMRRDARKHRSPNAGWPEAAMAGALGLSLAGPRSYGGEVVEDAYMGEGGRREAESTDIRQALKLYRMADWLLLGLFGALSAIVIYLTILISG
ncbi:cobalamin biosynthesis protein CobD [Mesorhizobium sp. M2D.F.Ca.ET.185.01.1.1]|uniref:adenosylcobinamide-phosphate synthase CbiB n=1 Tax=unclassified Mesorhizobium TaxID=325217 RepID=UPI000FCAADF0|nr:MULTISPECIES: adenosylcobinamide-phosphate synthase CbiB [unclassified Mesorhizobium]TGP50249.1 cobalamin biosynthesis protein CobD [bacterium M00.F.Ca.ET.230.01.1.1]TGP79421.1 cobalamin biosynthesis protein CobD [bacterium M00.F.Ca.ET.227.01.1.1]TGQ00841.1 cobalamin biosynthesis protein CobD [bacterium M00.F.Ca.ET.221.01.1.1]TGQ02638.1 cobalamin biosynthesis protein CobD [bacterium M00.F.Ca.ET.222.01.1.1]TGU12531.1 cobalamin biosynthesis protein CobD [bacterium M00.F.Ca.ET.163.01.1.1]TGU3